MAEDDRKLTEEDLNNMVENDIPEEPDMGEDEDGDAALKEFLAAIGQEEETPTEEQPEVPAESEEQPPPGEELPPTEQAEIPPEQPPEEPPAEEPPPNVEEQVNKEADVQEAIALLESIAQAVENEFATREGAEPPTTKEIALSVAQKFEAMLNEPDEPDDVRALKQQLAEKDREFSLFQELADLEKEGDYADHKDDIKKALEGKKDLNPGDYKTALMNARASKYQSPKAMMDAMLKDPKMLDELAKSPELKQRIADALRKDAYEKNKDIPPVSPQSGGNYQKSVPNPKNSDEAFDMMVAYADRRKSK